MKLNKLKYFAFLSFALMAVSSCGGNNPAPSSSSSSAFTRTSVVHSEPGEYVQGTYSNPVAVKNDSNQPYTGEVADPSIYRENENFYLFATNGISFKSQDCCTWKSMGKVPAKYQWAKDEVPETVTCAGVLWAPDVIKVDDVYFYYYSVSTSDPYNWTGIGYMTSESIEGPWSNERKLFWGNECTPKIKNCIDPQIFECDGHYYCYVGSFLGDYAVEVEFDGDEITINEEKTATLIAGKDMGYWDGKQYEGSYVVEGDDDYYYYFASKGTCCYDAGGSAKTLTYTVITGRSKSPLGPFLDKNGRDLKDSWIDNDVGTVCCVKDGIHTWAPGHNSIFIDDAGDWWLIYHAYTTMDNVKTRHLMMDKLEWDDKGFPYVDGYKKCCPSFQEELDGPLIFNAE